MSRHYRLKSDRLLCKPKAGMAGMFAECAAREHMTAIRLHSFLLSPLKALRVSPATKWHTHRDITVVTCSFELCDRSHVLQLRLVRSLVAAVRISSYRILSEHNSPSLKDSNLGSEPAGSLWLTTEATTGARNRPAAALLALAVSIQFARRKSARHKQVTRVRRRA